MVAIPSNNIEAIIMGRKKLEITLGMLWAFYHYGWLNEEGKDELIRREVEQNKTRA